MDQFESHLAEVHAYFESDDHSLALRRLTDCAIETQDTDIFRKTIGYYEWLEGHEQAGEGTAQEKRERAFQLLENIRRAGLKKDIIQAGSPSDDVPGLKNEKILSVDQLNKTYEKSGFSIKGVNLDLYERQITGLVGENGHGKTTLLRLLAAELKPDHGDILYYFTSRDDSQYALRTRLIYIEQRIPRWYGTLMDNLQFVLPFYEMRGDDNQAWADIMIARLGLRPYRHLSWNRISSGYRTRFELAKTLLRKPKILLLDEPLANLDINSQQTILQDLKYMANSISAPFGMILSSQHIYEVEKVSDQIIFIKNGEPQYQDNRAKPEEEQHIASSLIFEMETKSSRDELVHAFRGLQMQKIHFNGGVYLLYFAADTPVSSVLEAMVIHKIEPGYLRNISQSSRRFFIN